MIRGVPQLPSELIYQCIIPRIQQSCLTDIYRYSKICRRLRVIIILNPFQHDRFWATYKESNFPGIQGIPQQIMKSLSGLQGYAKYSETLSFRVFMRGTRHSIQINITGAESGVNARYGHHVRLLDAFDNTIPLVERTPMILVFDRVYLYFSEDGSDVKDHISYFQFNGNTFAVIYAIPGYKLGAPNRFIWGYKSRDKRAARTLCAENCPFQCPKHIYV